MAVVVTSTDCLDALRHTRPLPPPSRSSRAPAADLRAADPADPASIVQARLIERAAIVRWINEHNAVHGLPLVE